MRNLRDPNPEPPVSYRQQSWIQRHFKGWRFGVLTGAILNLIVFIVNIATAAYVGTRKDDNKINVDTRKTIFEGDCGKVRELNVGIHLVINVLSTILLSASNYAMQCLSAPTRSEIDIAHSNRLWMDIGVLSLTNIRKISKRRSFLWILLGMSSIPLHLFYNSAVYSSVYAQDYTVYSATEDMIRANSSLDNWQLSNGTTVILQDLDAEKLVAKALANELDRLNNSDCIKAYATEFPTQRTNLILVSVNNVSQVPGPYVYDVVASTVGSAGNGCAAHPYNWICYGNTYPCWESNPQKSCADKLSSLDPLDWRPFGLKVDYCLSDTFEQKCSLRFTPQLAAIVIVFNFIKLLTLAYTFLSIKENPLMTIGDAIASFLRRSDETTSGLCLMSKDHINWWDKATPISDRPPRPYSLRRSTWSTTGSKIRWITCLLLYTIAIISCLLLFFHGIIGRDSPASELMSLALGTTDPRTFVYGWKLSTQGVSALISNVIIANLPQIILSGIYFTYNGLFTCFMLGNEWDQYGRNRKGLRVSNIPQGAQRRTYFLQLPFRFALPLVVVSGVLHWLCSQSIFVVSLTIGSVYFSDIEPQSGNIVLSEFITCGYSPRAILGVILIGIVMVIVVILTGRKRHNGVIPVAGSCSAAISAMCHISQSENSKDVATQPLQWGVTDYDRDPRKDEFAVGHCSFSDQEVQLPVEGLLYAGSASAFSDDVG